MTIEDQLIIQGNIVTNTGILRDHFIQIEKGLIQTITDKKPETGASSLDARGLYILPGFRDQHIHDITGQLPAQDWSVEQRMERIRTVTQSLASQGVTAVYLSTFGGPLEQLTAYCEGVRSWMDSGKNGRVGAKVMGTHVEGTFINEECRGAQPVEYCLIPTRDDCVDALNRLHDTGSLRIANIAPDYGHASLEIIRHANELGVLVGAGHTQADADLLRRAYEDSGLRFMVHFTNGPTGQSFKPFDGGGAFEGAMNLPMVKELILDRVHVDGRYVLDIIKRTEERWGLNSIITITDAIFPVPDEIPSDEFTVGSTIARADETGRSLRTVSYLQPDGSRVPAPVNTLCSSLLSMDRAFSNLVTLFARDVQGHWFNHPSMDLDQAIVKASYLCATTQAALDGSDSHTGALTPGKDADLTIGRLIEGENDYTFEPRYVFVEGKKIFEAP